MRGIALIEQLFYIGHCDLGAKACPFAELGPKAPAVQTSSWVVLNLVKRAGRVWWRLRPSAEGTRGLSSQIGSEVRMRSKVGSEETVFEGKKPGVAVHARRQ